MLLDEFANIGQIPQFEKLIEMCIRDREKPDKMQVDSDTLAEVGDTDLQKSEKPNSRSLRSRLQELSLIHILSISSAVRIFIIS